MPNTAGGGIAAGRNTDQNQTQANVTAGKTTACPGMPNGASVNSIAITVHVAGNPARAA